MVKDNVKLKDLFPIKEIKEDINLFMFNSKLFSFSDMKNYNKFMEVLANVKIEVPNSI